MDIEPKVLTELSKRQVIIYLDEDGDGYWADCPSLPGCHSQGDTWEETVKNIKEAIELWVEDALKHGDPIPDDSVVWIGRV
jgi:predicted RNase H-like HicB family nuclease